MATDGRTSVEEERRSGTNTVHVLRTAVIGVRGLTLGDKEHSSATKEGKDECGPCETKTLKLVTPKH